MKPRRELVMLSGLLRQSQPTDAQRPKELMAIQDGDHGIGPAEEWSMRSHSSGLEPWIVGLEELYRLRRMAGNADVPAEELVLMEP